MKFNVGDKVRIVKNVWSFENNHSDIGIGEVHTITGCYSWGKYTYTLSGLVGLKWCDEELERAVDQKVVITTDGIKITTAKLYEDGKCVKSATAKCCPADTFDFNVGAKLALERLTAPEKQKEESKWRVVNRPVREGDYIRIISTCFTFNKKGDILKVSSVTHNDMANVYAKDHPRATGATDNYVWHYHRGYYEVVELEDDERPLTIEDLMQMDGQKVWVSSLRNGVENFYDWYCGWRTVNVANQEVRRSTGFYFFGDMNENYGFRAYRKPPKQAKVGN